MISQCRSFSSRFSNSAIAFCNFQSHFATSEIIQFAFPNPAFAFSNSHFPRRTATATTSGCAGWSWRTRTATPSVRRSSRHRADSVYAGNVIEIDAECVHAEPRDLNVLPENTNRKDARTLDKLIDGNNLDFTHSWLAPFTETNAIFVCFDAAVAISRLTLWNYANTCVEINQCVRCTDNSLLSYSWR